MMKNKLKSYRKGSVAKDFEIDSEGIGELFRKKVNEQAAAIIQESDFYVDFPALWGPKSDGEGGCGVKDPLIIYFTVEIGEDEDHPILKFNLRDTLKNDLEACAEDGSFAEQLESIRLALVAWCSEIKKAIDTGKE